MVEDRIEIDVTRAQADTILASLKYRAAMTRGFNHEDSIGTYYNVKQQIEQQSKLKTMPNHVTHKAEFFGKQRDVDFILNILKTEENGNGEQWTRHIDFNNIIPQPKSLFLGDLCKEEEERTRGWNWYDWNRENWGTKWNAYSTTRNGNTITFDTAWASPTPVMEKLHEICKKYNVECEVFYADEDSGCNTGLYKLGGERFKHIQFDNYSPDAWMAYRKTHPDWEDYYTLNEDGTMVYKEEE